MATGSATLSVADKRGCAMVWVRKIPTGWWLAGVVVLSAAAATSALSFRFVYGENHAGRPIYAFLALYLLGWGGFAYAAMRAMRGGGGVPVLFVVIVGLAARAILLPSNLIQENDCYRYVLDGEAVLHGVNPYRHAPEDVASDTRGAFARSLEGKDARLVVSRIGYRHIPTIYPPAAQAAFAVGARLTPWDWRGQRWVFLAFDVATMALLLHVLRATGKPAAWIVVYAWNPLILKEVANAAHLDAMAGFCIVLTVWAMVRWAASDRSAYAAVAGCALALAVLTKLYPLLLVPACLAFLWGRRRQWKAPAVFALALLAVTCLAYVPFLGVGLARMTEGLRTYGAEWQRNDGAFRIVQTAFRPVGGLAWGSVSRTISNPRLATACIVGAFALVQAWRAGKGKRRELLKRSESQVRAAKETRDRPVS
ncbi:MAG: glycosyltransferase family 39 protein, partial [bacterium]|nr:glycosyltransferase family 39 protein [bacterium]